MTAPPSWAPPGSRVIKHSASLILVVPGANGFEPGEDPYGTEDPRIVGVFRSGAWERVGSRPPVALATVTLET